MSVYAGLDPVTGKRLYLTDSTTDEAEARRILRRLTAEVNGQRHSKTRATLQTTIEAWLDTQELAERTLETYREYAANHIYPVLGPEPLARATPHVLERIYAELRRCADRCDGQPAVDHRVDGPHECREVRHKRPPGRPPAAGYPPHDCAEKGCRIIECQPHACRPLAPATVRKIHFIIRGALAAAVRWGWLASNPAEIARIPGLPPPDPDPPSSAEAAALVNAAWAEGVLARSWGHLPPRAGSCTTRGPTRVD